jgi:hypothetical protein
LFCVATSQPGSGVITVIRTSKSAIFKRLMLDIGASLRFTDIIFIFSIPLATHTYKT